MTELQPLDEAEYFQDDYGQDDYDPSYERYCLTCDNKGWVLTCIDDICHGLGYCIHGDGYSNCPDCDNEWDFSNVPEEAFPADLPFDEEDGDE